MCARTAGAVWPPYATPMPRWIYGFGPKTLGLNISVGQSVRKSARFAQGLRKVCASRGALPQPERFQGGPPTHQSHKAAHSAALPAGAWWVRHFHAPCVTLAHPASGGGALRVACRPLADPDRGRFSESYPSQLSRRNPLGRRELPIIAGTGPGAGQRIARSPTGRWHRTC